MLKLKEVKKVYGEGEFTVNALKGIDVNFRTNEFVAILGPSGCGKTTMLNIIGGLDRYTSGDLMINGVSTKKFKDRDWDNYRNHSVGFVFQSYNLIPHQTILGNVELALTISGVSKQERVERAKEALDKVGLAGLYHKRPNQLSGGQMQRVAIARSLVNDPEILLADEPTGALDSVTSVQVMDLLKEIAKERLVIMVTHNPELAEAYATRIIRLLDGELIDDSRPFSNADANAEEGLIVGRAAAQQQKAAQDAAENAKNKKQKKNKADAPAPDTAPPLRKAKMSFWTAFRLSLQNLFSKRGRTVMTCIAGSIGIIGISLVLSISTGVTSFISDMQNDMLSGNPISVTKSAYDLSAMMGGMSFSQKKKAVDIEDGKVNVDSMIEYLVSQSDSLDSMVVSNAITAEYIDFVKQMPEELYAMLFLDYGLDMTNNIYTDWYLKKADKEANGGAGQNAVNMSLSTLTAMYTSVLEQSDYGAYSSYITTLSQSFSQAPSNEEYLLSQYDLKHGSVAKAADEVMIVLSDESELTDLVLAQLGYYTQDEFINIMFREANKISDNKYKDDYREELNKVQFDYSELVGKGFTWYPNDTVYNNVFDGTAATFTNPFTYNAYSADFTVANKKGVPLKVVGILQPKASLSYGCLQTGFYYTEALAEHMIDSNKGSETATFLTSMSALFGAEIMFSNTTITTESGSLDMPRITYKYKYSYPYGDTPIIDKEMDGIVGKSSSLSTLLGAVGMGGGGNIYTLDLQQLGGKVDDNGKKLVNGLYIYPTSFKTKDAVLDYLDNWNAEANSFVNNNGETVTLPTSRNEIKYTDNLSLIIAMINDMIKIVTYALVGFTSLSLVVSCVMIAIITYVSVVERIKEIGVIRSLGGRKRDVSNLFVAETFIIGFISGLIGILFTYLVSAIANIATNITIGISIALFPWYYAVIMVTISVVLTLISGVMPSRAAAKKDPVVALRTE